jgi:hypothetical protein
MSILKILKPCRLFFRRLFFSLSEKLSTAFMKLSTFPKEMSSGLLPLPSFSEKMPTFFPPLPSFPKEMSSAFLPLSSFPEK